MFIQHWQCRSLNQNQIKFMQIVFKSCTHTFKLSAIVFSHVKHLVSIGLLVCLAFFFNENLDAKQEFANDFLHVFCLIKGWLHLSFGHTSNTERESRPTSYIQGSWNHAITNPGIEVPPYQKTLKQTKLTYYCSTESPLMGWAFERDNFPINNAAIFHQTQHYNFCSKRIVTTLWIHLQISNVQNGSLVYT